MKKSMFWLVSLLLLMASCGEKEQHKTLSKTDANGYKYEEVTNDPFNARIYTLDNGLKVYLSKNTDEPRIQTIIAVRAGSKDEPCDNTGLAHYLEHLMFKGSSNLGTSDWGKEQPLLDSISNLFEQRKATTDPKERQTIYKQIDQVSQAASQYAISNEYDKMVGALGANGTNAFTNYDLTAYINDIPSNEIDRFLHLEYDRFANMQLRLFHTELETVYEEFNMYQDMGQSLTFEKMFGALFDEHPYKVDVIGLPEHLKNPSMKSVMAFQKRFYVPNNMAICMTGDLDFEKTIQSVDKYFGQMKSNDDLQRPAPVVEKPLKENKIVNIATPEPETIMMAFRGEGAKSKDALYLDMITSLMNNGKAGLVDIDLVQKQKVLWMEAGNYQLKDYGLFYFYGAPREGQTLEEVADLILGEIEKLKKGDFDKDLMQAVINNKKLAIINASDSRQGACFGFLNSFINEESWQDELSKIDELSKLTKEDIMTFANQYFANHYVTVYKRTGENTGKVTVDKPEITAIKINRDTESAFAKELMAEKPAPIEPVFIDFKEKIKQEKVQQGVDFYYTKNVNNKLYQLNHFVEIGSNTDKKLALAFQYLPYLGTSKYTPEQLQLEMYKLGMSFNAISASNRAYVMLSGLDETLDQSIALMEEILSDPVADEEAYTNLVNDILKERTNNKLEKRTILFRGLLNYAKYGPKSSFTDILSEEELRNIKPEELIAIVKEFSSYEHGFYYYGPRTDGQMLTLLKKQKTPETLKPIPAEVIYPELPMDKPAVYFADYDMVQNEIMFLAKDVKFDVNLLPYQQMFNSYYGAGMNSIVFQEIREARGLAYTAYAYTTNPSRTDQSNYIQGYVGTQSDKMIIAMDAFRGLLREMPAAEKQFQLSKENVLSNLRSERLTKSDIFWTYLYWKKLGIDYDVRKPIFETISTMELADVEKFFDEHIKPANYSVLIVGKKKNTDFNYLKQYGEVKEYSLKELFGY